MKIKSLPFAVMQACMGITVGAIATSAMAQQPQKIDKVEVTGSNIKRVEGETALPVTVITRKDIERSGAVGVEDVIRRISASTAMFSDATQGAGYATSNANLRGLGANSTLILLNGRRLANHAFGSIGGTAAVDLNSIPFNAIDRIEVLRDGASAIYGTDAVGGVINFITRSDYRGGEFTVRYGTPEESYGGKDFGANIGYGQGDLARDGYNLLLTLGHQVNQRLKAIDQKLYNRYTEVGASAPTSFRAFPGRIMDFGFSPGGYAGTLTTSANIAACNPEITFLQTSGTTPSGNPRYRCRGLYPAFIDNLPDSRRTDFYGHFTRNLSSDHQLFADFSFARNHNIGRIAPVPIDQTALHVSPNGTQANVLLPITSRYAPLALIQRLGYSLNDLGTPGFLEIALRSVPLGNRINDNQNDQSRVSTGMKGVVAGWDYNSAFTYAQAKDHLKYFGYVHEQRFLNALRTGNINPFGANDAAGDALLKTTLMEGDMRDSKSTTTQLDGKISRDLMAMAGGQMAVALGVDLRREAIDDKPVSDDYRQGLHIGGEGTIPNVAASRNVAALFGELSLPVAKGLEVGVALRFDRYSDFGSKTNPRVSIRWQPNKEVLFRGSAGTGFRAPTLWDLKSPPAFSNSANPLTDPGCPAALIANGDPRCVDTQLTTRTSSSSSLKPETSKQYSVGMVVDPVKWLSVSLDYWSINKKDQIGSINADTILADPSDLTLYNRYRSRFVRTAVGTTLYVDQPVENLGELKTAGWDLDTKLTFNVESFGKVGISYQGTYIEKWDSQTGKGEPFKHYVGNSLNGGVAYPRWTHTLAFDFQRGDWSGSIENTYTRGWKEVATNGTTGDPFVRDVEETSRFNLSGKYTGLKNISVKLGVRNVEDKLPPYTATSSNGSHAEGYSNSVADPRGRFWYGSVTYSFK